MTAALRVAGPCITAPGAARHKRGAFDHRLQHGYDWRGQDLTNWDLSQKMDGVRAYWDGAELWTRGGNRIEIPAVWRAELPALTLDCELYHGLDGLYRCGGAARSGRFLPGMELVCFEAPTLQGNWRARMDAVDALAAGIDCLRTPPRWHAQSTPHALRIMRSVHRRGGEGLVARSPALIAQPGRTAQVLKLKTGAA